MLLKRALLILLLSGCPAMLQAQTDSVYLAISRIKDPVKRIDSLNAYIRTFWQSGDYDNGTIIAKYTLADAKKSRYKKGEAGVLNNLGVIYDYQGSYATSLGFYFKALSIEESINDEKGLASTCSNIGLVYCEQKNFSESLKFHHRALRLRKKLKNRAGISASYNNIGIVYMDQKQYDRALENYLVSVSIDKELGDIRGIGDSYNNIGLIYMEKGDYPQAEYYFLESTKIRRQNEDQRGISLSYNNLGTLYSKQHQWDKARSYFDQAIDIAIAIGSKENIKYGFLQLSEIDRETGNFEDALENYKIYTAYGDSVANTANTRLQARAEMQYGFDKQLAKDKLDQQKRDFENEKSRDFLNYVLWSVAALAGLTAIFSIFLYRRWKVAREQKTIIEEKNRLVEIKNREILDSISYAKRIQSAILPPEKLVKEFLVDSFILYKPKDIVAGDFYWMEAQGANVIFAAADCTGHGVPGALISVVCHNALNRSVREFGLTSPGKILDKTREIIIQEFEKSVDDVNDGMDISLCSLNLETLKLEWSGANNPLWLLRTGETEVRELKANKQPIGKYSKYETFDTHELQLAKGDSLYLFTDGFADQFGGPDHKKFKSRQMKTFVAGMKDRSMEEQRIVFDRTFEDWKGELEQVDDVCVIGLRV